jgi:hypothetical protein
MSSYGEEALQDAQEKAVDEIQDYLNSKAVAFDKLCVDRHEDGAARYGATTFLENDVVRMMLEELADTANYCRMQAIKLLVLQDRLEAQLEEQNMVEGDNLGFKQFKGTKNVGWH